jgi:hypothetical protein
MHPGTVRFYGPNNYVNFFEGPGNDRDVRRSTEDADLVELV